MLLDQSEADALLAVLCKTPIFRKHPELVKAFNELRYKRFLANPDLSGVKTWGPIEMAKRLGGVLALAYRHPPQDIMDQIADVLDAGHTYLLLCAQEKDRIDLAERAEIYCRTRRHQTDPRIVPTDAAHRAITL